MRQNNRNSRTEDHLEATKYWGPSNNTVLAVNHFNRYNKRALDLGCGSLRNSRFLFNCGFIVDAIDKDPRVKNYIDFFKTRPSGLFNLKIDDYLKCELGIARYDIVVAQNTLSFNNKEEVIKTIGKIYGALKGGGVFAGNLYGLKDFRAGQNKGSFYTEEEIGTLLNKFKVMDMLEDEGDMEENGVVAHWHTFEFVAQKM